MPSRRAVRWRVLPPVWRHGEVADPAQLDRARRISAALVEATASFSLTESPTVEQMARFGELNLAFHQALIALAKSPMLQLSLDRVQSIAFASPAAVVTPAEPGGFAKAIREHEADSRRHSDGRCSPRGKLVREHARFALRGVKNAIDRPGHAAKAKVDRRRIGDAAENKRRTDSDAESAGPTSQLVLDAAAALFCEKGFSETTTREIAARSEYSSGIALLPHLRKRGTALSHQQSLLSKRGAAGPAGARKPRKRARPPERIDPRASPRAVRKPESRACLNQRIPLLSRAHRREIDRAARELLRSAQPRTRVGRESRHPAQGHSRLSPSARASQLSQLDTALVSALGPVASGRSRRNLRPGVFRGHCRSGPTQDLPCPNCRIRGAIEPARHTAALSASSSAQRRNCFRNRVTRPPAHGPSRH